MLVFNIKWDLFLQFLLTLVTSIILWFQYTQLEVKDKLDWKVTLYALATISSITHLVISMTNFMVHDECSEKDKSKLANAEWNFSRNFISSLSAVSVALLYGMVDGDVIIATLILVGASRLMDAALDCDNLLTIQCTDQAKKNERRIRTMIGALGLGTAIIFLIIYLVDHPINLEDTHTKDDVSLLLAIILLSIHEFLILLGLLLNISGVKSAYLGKVNGECDNIGIHMPNELPLVSKAVFTVVLGSLAIALGECIQQEKNITTLLWVISLVGTVEVFGKNIL